MSSLARLVSVRSPNQRRLKEVSNVSCARRDKHGGARKVIERGADMDHRLGQRPERGVVGVREDDFVIVEIGVVW